MTQSPGRGDPAGGETPDLVDAMRRLAVLRDRDVLTEPEYRVAKAKLVDEQPLDGPAS